MRSPLFAEWLQLAGVESLAALTEYEPPAATQKEGSPVSPLRSSDCLLVIDMQRDFVPRDDRNVQGGRLGCPEARNIVKPLCVLMRHAGNVGALLVCSRDYHPVDHCSFTTAGGPFPPHCVQGTSGSELLPEVASELSNALARNGPSQAAVVFKAFHECVDSFGALPYAGAPHGEGRIQRVPVPDNAFQAHIPQDGANNGTDAPGSGEAGATAADNGGQKAAHSVMNGCLGCASAPWTGSIALKQSALRFSRQQLLSGPGEGEGTSDVTFNVNAPPDLLSLMFDGVDRQPRTLQRLLYDHQRKHHLDKQSGEVGEGGRVVVVGLALDYCVFDTCMNAIALGIKNVVLCIDMSRAAHVAGVGAHGSGFLSDPADLMRRLKEAGVQFKQVEQLLPPRTLVKNMSERDLLGDGFPHRLGSLTLQAAPLKIRIVPDDEQQKLEQGNVSGAVGESSAQSTEGEASQANQTEEGGGVKASVVSPRTRRQSERHYSMALTGSLSALWRGGGGAHSFLDTGNVSAQAPIPPDWPAVPEDCGATYLCWAFPTRRVTARAFGPEDAKMFMAISASPELRFAAYGGFLLLDDAGNVVCAQAVGITPTKDDEAADLHFHEPKSWRNQFTEQLEEQGRLQLVTVPSLKSRGASKFCWLNPGESLSVEGEHWTPSTTGGFLYLRDDDAEPLYFPRKSSTETSTAPSEE